MCPKCARTPSLWTLLALFNLLFAVPCAQAQPPELEVTKNWSLALDANGNGLPDPGETLQWAILVRNPSTTTPLTQVVFVDDDDTQIGDPQRWFNRIPGSVTTSRGTIVHGNGTVERVVIDVGTLGPQQSAAIQFQSIYPTGFIGNLCNWGLASYTAGTTPLTERTDDPSTGADDDPTCLRLPTGGLAPILEAPLTDALFTDLDADGLADPGDTLRYTARVRHRPGSPINALNLTFETPLEPHVQLVAGSVATTRGSVEVGNTPGANAVRVNVGTLVVLQDVVITFDARVVNPLPPAVAEIVLQGAVQADGVPGLATDDPDTAALGDPTRTPLDADPDLAVTITDGGVSATAGETIAYTLTTRNLSPRSPAPNATLALTLPGASRLESAGSSAGWSCLSGVCRLALGTLGPSTNLSRTLVVRVDLPLAAGVSRFDTSAAVADDGSAGPDLDPSNNTATETTPVDRGTTGPDLALLKTDHGISVEPGQVVVYTLAATNEGNQNTTGVTVTETVPERTAFAAASSSAGWSCPEGAAAGARCSAPLGALAGLGGSALARFAVRALPDSPGGTSIDNNATVTDDGASGPDHDPNDNTATDSTPVVAPDLTFSKTLAPSSDARPGGVLVWQLRVENRGGAPGRNLRLEEQIPQHTRFEPASSDPAWSCAPDTSAGSVCELPLGDLAPGAVTVRAFAARIDNPLGAGVESITNCATLQAGPIGRGLPEEACLDVPITGATPDLTLSKSDGGVSTGPGRVVAYSLSYANVGTQGATGVTITETVPGLTTFDFTASTPGWICPNGPGFGQVCRFALPELPGGAQGLVTFAVRVDSALPGLATQIVNRASIADDGANGSDPTPANNAAEDQTPITPAGPGPQPALRATKADVLVLDTNDDGAAGAGDTVTYLIDLDNLGQGPADGVTFRSEAPAGTRLVPRSVTATVGVITLGEGPDDAAVEVQIARLDPGARSAISFDVVVEDPVPRDLEELVCQGQVTASNHRPLVTDDPETPLRDDPTRTPLVHAGEPPPRPAQDIPTLATWGLLVLFAALAGLGANQLNRLKGRRSLS